MEPAPVLVRTFQIHIGRKGQLRTLFQHGREARAGIEPDVQDVRFLAPVGTAAGGTGQARRDDGGQVGLEPPVAAAFVSGELGRHVPHPFGIVVGRIAGFAQKRHDGHAPGPLTRDAPVRAKRDHIVDAFLAPGRNPFHVGVDGVQRLLAQIAGFHGDEPLGGGPENHRLLAAPAVGIGMANFTLGEQVADFLELSDDLGIGFPDGQSGEIRDHVQKTAGVVQR